MSTDPNIRLAATVHFVRELGFTLSLDLDGGLIVKYPPTVSVEAMNELLEKCAPHLAHQIKVEANRERRQFVGGPLNGQRHGEYGGWQRHIVWHLGRGRWAAYYMCVRSPGEFDDGRAFYVGEATSQAKARKLASTQGPRLFHTAERPDHD